MPTTDKLDPHAAKFFDSLTATAKAQGCKMPRDAVVAWLGSIGIPLPDLIYTGTLAQAEKALAGGVNFRSFG